MNPNEKTEIETAFKDAEEMGHVCICEDCARRYFRLPKDFNPQYTFRVNGKYFIDVDCCENTICEFGKCMQDGSYILGYDKY